MKLYEFNQNNTGGGFDVDDKVCHRVVVEAKDEKEAISIAEELGCYWDGVANGMDCECCGDRWYESPSEIDLKSVRESYKEDFSNLDEYFQFMADYWGWTKPDIRVFYKDGTVKEIFSK